MSEPKFTHEERMTMAGLTRQALRKMARERPKQEKKFGIGSFEHQGAYRSRVERLEAIYAKLGGDLETVYGGERDQAEPSSEEAR